MTSGVRRSLQEGLAGGRPGRDTFITATAAPVSPEARPDLRAWPGAWLRAADEAGLDEEAVTALLAVARHDPREERV
jgi:hypothetical protein